MANFNLLTGLPTNWLSYLIFNTWFLNVGRSLYGYMRLVNNLWIIFDKLLITTLLLKIKLENFSQITKTESMSLDKIKVTMISFFLVKSSFESGWGADLDFWVSYIYFRLPHRGTYITHVFSYKASICTDLYSHYINRNQLLTTYQTNGNCCPYSLLRSGKGGRMVDHKTGNGSLEAELLNRAFSLPPYT